MKRSRYSEGQIISILKEFEGGSSASEISRKYGVAEQTFYKWKKKYGGMDESDAVRLRTMEEENRKLKRIVANLTIDLDTARELLRKNF